MKVNFIGRRDLDFDTKDGSHIEGLRMYVTYPASEGGRDEGTVCELMFCNIKRAEYQTLKDAKLPAVLEVEYNKYGKADSFKVVK